MDHKLSVLIQIDLDGAYVRLVVTGCLTEANQHALHPLIRRARTLIPPVTVSIDLTTAGHLEAAAVQSLRWAVDHDTTRHGASPVQVVVPHDLPAHRPAPAQPARSVQELGWAA